MEDGKLNLIHADGHIVVLVCAKIIDDDLEDAYMEMVHNFFHLSSKKTKLRISKHANSRHRIIYEGQQMLLYANTIKRILNLCGFQVNTNFTSTADCIRLRKTIYDMRLILLQSILPYLFVI